MNRRNYPYPPAWLLLVLVLSCDRARAVTWFPFGPDGGDARAFAGDPKDPQHVYLGTTTGWVYQTQDGGKKWVRLARVGKRDDLVIDNIVIDPTNAKHIVVGAWKLTDLHNPDGGMYVSNDGGTSWTSTPEMREQSVLALTFAPSDPKIMVAGTMSGVFRSEDSGAHWKQISQAGDKELHEVESVAIDPADPGVIYAGTWHLPWKTTDGGEHWTSIKQGIAVDSDVFSIIVDPKQPNVVYASACSGIYKSEDKGAKFAAVQGIPSTAHRTRVLMQDPNRRDTVFAGTTEGLYRTDDAGKVWTQTTGADVIVNDVYVDPTDSRRVLLATDRSGVLASDDGGSSFIASNTGFSTRQITAYTADAQHAATLYVGVVNDKQWGGVFVSRTGGLSWSQMSGGLDGRDVFSLGQAPDGTIVAGTGHGIYLLKAAIWQRAGDDLKIKPSSAKAAGTSGKKLLPAGNAGQLGARRPMEAKAAGSDSMAGSVYGFAVSGQTMYAATYQGLLRSDTNGVTWSPAAAIPMDEYRFLAAAKTYVVAASLTATEMSADSGSTWRAVVLPEKVTQVSAVSVDGHGNVWVGGREGVYYTSDKGASWQTLKGLYVRNANSLFYDAAADRILVTAAGPATVAFAVQLPSMQVSSWDTGWDLRFVRPVGDHLVAGTLYDGIVVQPRMVDPAERAVQ